MWDELCSGGRDCGSDLQGLGLGVRMGSRHRDGCCSLPWSEWTDAGSDRSHQPCWLDKV